MENSEITSIDMNFNWAVIALYEVVGWFGITDQGINLCLSVWRGQFFRFL